MHSHNLRTVLALGAAVAFFPGILGAQRGGGSRTRSIEIDPPQVTLAVGASTVLKATVRDASGETLPVRVLFLTRAPRSLTVGQDGRIEAHAPGTFSVIARVPGSRGRDGEFLTAEAEVVVPFPSIERVEITNLPDVLYSGTVVRPEYIPYDSSNTVRSPAELTFGSSDTAVVRVDRYGQLTPGNPGTAVLRMVAGAFVQERSVSVEASPVRSIELIPVETMARTGDVVRFRGLTRDEQGRELNDVPVMYSVSARDNPLDAGYHASAYIAPDGRFVAERPGAYTVTANAGPVLATATIDVVARDIERQLEVVGRGAVRDYHTSDLWVWGNADGHDYAMTGTWGGNGEAYIWDVTDPGNITRVSTVSVDARTVNDVKVSEDGRIAVITREGASNRRNGIVILDVSDPRAVKEITAFDDGLTGGVHNVFLDSNYVYAINNGIRYDVINVGEPSMPFRVSAFELDTPGHSVHDVWVDDGIAYSSNWEDGVVLTDVGNGIAGGTPDRPVEISSWHDLRGDTHASFPFRSQSTGRFYVIVGEEIFPNGINPQGPTVPAGYMHIVDFTDLRHPVEVARFEVPEAGSHNMWVEDDVLYAAFYNGGLRVVDLSGELMGDLYRQGREIARFVPKDAFGVVPNEAMVWGAQPYKGVIYLSDWNSGLWAVRLKPEDR